ncbi:hypothetical protein DDE74_39200 [Streptomyces lydicus]|uniref:CoA transferase n=1 Tax=Streptomyces lydicus TaxID=47763 RepID=A0A3S9YML4_9ACTN|nr:CoA transferase [Streptomyces lydicus]AZS76087.1 hypothetical protein DDE74_39200 [Streptomyces lydicus]
MERLGLGPDERLAANPGLVHAQMPGWGQDGPFAPRAGHDIGYRARGRAVPDRRARRRRPAPPLNVVGDFGGGMLLALGVVAAAHHAARTGEGQVVDAAITDGTVLLTTMLRLWRAAGVWTDECESNMPNGGAHYYHVYETADGLHLAVGAIEPQFYRRSVDTAAPATALRTWLGEPHTRMAKGQQGEPGQPEGRKSTGQRRGEV